MNTLTGGREGVLDPPEADEAGTAPGDRRFRPDVEGLRAVAVLLVVLYHAELPGLSGGYVGVDVFFVISGFVITGLLLRERSATGRTSLLAFYGRRVRRILPAATVVIVVTVLATYAAVGVVTGDPTAIAARWTAVFLANIHFAATGTDYLSSTLPPSPLQNFWSLAVEEQFYLVYPALVLIVASWRTTVSLRVRLGIVLVPVIAGSILLSAVQTGSSPTWAYFSPLTRAWELALGALVAVATPTLLRIPRHLAGAMTWAGMAAIAVAAVTFSSTTAYPGTAVIVPVVGAALVVAGGTPVPGRGTEAVLRLGPFQWVGRLSYSLSLWHWPLLILAAEAAGRQALPFHRAVVWLLVSVAAAWLTFRLIEDPVRHARALARRPWLTIGVGVALVSCSLVVATVALTVSDGGAGGPVDSAPAGGAALAPAEVQRLVLAAPGITSLPHDLVPTLAGVRFDWGGPNAPCWPGSAQTTVGTCLFGDPTGAHTLVLYGDSHAAMWFSVIDQIATASHWRLLILTKGYCPPLGLAFPDPPGSGSPGGRFTACDRWHAYALRRIRQIRPDAVILTQEADSSPHRTGYPPATWEAAEESVISQMPVPADRVLVLGNIPMTPGSGPECLALHPNDVQQCSGQDAGHFARLNAAEQRAAEATGARYIDTVPWFCSTTCTDVIGHFLPYWDPYHVTATYAGALGRVLADAIDLPGLATAGRG